MCIVTQNVNMKKPLDALSSFHTLRNGTACLDGDIACIFKALLCLESSSAFSFFLNNRRCDPLSKLLKCMSTKIDSCLALPFPQNYNRFINK